jgi:tRNA(fMet)-specific endonuclease VapC
LSRRFLLDTNVVSEPVKPEPNANIVGMLKRNERALVLASPVWHELLFGVRRLQDSKRRRRLDRYLAEVVRPSMAFLPYDERAALWHAEERARLSALGLTPPFVDGQIAAIAAVNECTLVTRNVADFEAFHGLDVEDWSKP